MDLILVRHGEIDANNRKHYTGRSEDPLNDLGLNQAREVGLHLAGDPVSMVVSSPLLRTRQTAQFIAEPHGLDVQMSEFFSELKMGPWEGLREEEVAQRWPVDWAIWNSRPAELVLPGRERLADVRDRILKGLDAIRCRSEASGSVVIVSHVAILRVLLLHAKQKNLNEYKIVRVDNAQPIRIQLNDRTYAEND